MKTKIAVLLLTLVVAVMFTSTPAKAGKPTVFVVPVDEIDTLVCAGENVHFTGTVTITASDDTENGIVHFVVHENGHVDGVGLTSGLRYTFNIDETVAENVNLVNGSGELNAVATVRIISQGSTDNEVGRETIHVQVVNGVTTITRSFVSDGCVG